ncbi:hypothetical protein RvY_18191 [Ramazzottius varieornatus]|uniref:Uncharacterized protein n=1 Tax=Ramazzottius varieornatus TaxID=947166 RepID=A0A1D1WAS8_RAMVA|nr:hypothetical protein RvY_18191 [Ramazzottius varieornatus]
MVTGKTAAEEWDDSSSVVSSADTNVSLPQVHHRIDSRVNQRQQEDQRRAEDHALEEARLMNDRRKEDEAKANPRFKEDRVRQDERNRENELAVVEL